MTRPSLPTRIAHTDIREKDGFTSLSTPIYRGSTIAFPSYDAFMARHDRGRKGYTYGLNGTPTSRTLEDKLTQLEEALETFMVPSGLMAITVAVLAVCSQGQRVLFPDTVYGPVRHFAAETLTKFGVDVAYYDPNQGNDIDFAQPGLRLVWIDSPGSATMEIQDIPTMAVRAHEHGVLVGCDNS